MHSDYKKPLTLKKALGENDESSFGRMSSLIPPEQRNTGLRNSSIQIRRHIIIPTISGLGIHYKQLRRGIELYAAVFSSE